VLEALNFSLSAISLAFIFNIKQVTGSIAFLWVIINFNKEESSSSKDFLPLLIRPSRKTPSGFFF